MLTLTLTLTLTQTLNLALALTLTLIERNALLWRPVNYNLAGENTPPQKKIQLRPYLLITTSMA